MCDTKISDAAVETVLSKFNAACKERALSGMGGTPQRHRSDHEIMRAALEAALPQLTQPAELAEQHGTELPPLPEAFEAEFATPGASPVSVYSAEQMQEYARAALAATGKQQVGETGCGACGDGCLGRPACRVAEESPPMQVGEVHGDALVNAKDCDSGPEGDWYCEKHPDALMGHGGCGGAGIPACARLLHALNWLRLARQEKRELHAQYGFLAEAALAARQPGASNQVVEEIEQLAVDSQPVAQEHETRLIEAIEGECDGLSLTRETASAILAHVALGDPWRDAVFSEWALTFIDPQSDVPAEILRAVIEWSVRTALDPSVSSDAAALVASGTQGIDLGQLRALVDELEAEINVAATSDNTLAQKVAETKRRVMIRLLALVDGQRDAAPGVGS